MATIQYVRYPTTAASTNASIGSNGAAIPSSSTLAGGEDPSLNLQPLQLDASKNLKVNVAAGALTVLNPSVSATGSAVPADATFAGMSVAGNLTGLTGTANGLQVDGSAVTQPVSAASLPLPTGASTSALQTQISGQLPSSLGAHLTAASLAVNIASDQTVPVSAASLPLPSGAATSALQTTGNTSLSSIDGKLASLGQKNMAGSEPVVIASDQSAIPTKAPVNANGSNVEATVSTVKTETAPANAVGFVLMNEDTSTANIRWKIGGVAGAASGQQLQPGRDTGYIPCAANISICAESSTQNYNLQWVLSA